MINFPDKLTTKRLILKPSCPAYTEAFYQAITSSKVSLERFEPWAVPMPTKAHIAAFMADITAKMATGNVLSLCLFTRDTNTLIGHISVTFFAEHTGARLGYWCQSSHQRQGYMSDALVAVLTWLKDSDLRRIDAWSDAANIPSHRLLEKHGFHREAQLKNHIYNRLLRAPSDSIVHVYQGNNHDSKN